MKVTKIYHPKKQKKAVQDVLRVAAYCRVSTNSEDQLNSFEVQQTVYTDMIRKKPGWELVDIYADRGITGTNAKKRPEFQRMIRDCNDGKIDCIICKSLSRFARNTRDAIFYIRKLQKLGVRLIIEKEKIDTDDRERLLKTTIDFLRDDFLPTLDGREYAASMCVEMRAFLSDCLQTVSA